MTAADCIALAVRVAATFRATTHGERGARHHVHAVLLHDPRVGAGAPEGRWGVYVGQTGRDPYWRFDQHKAGYKASGAVRRYGVGLMADATAHLNPCREWESLELEAALAQALRAASLAWVEGGH